MIHSAAGGQAMCLHPRGRPGDDAYQGCSMGELAGDLTRETEDVGRTVVDKTGLTGRYTFELRWAVDPSIDPANTNSSAPSIFTALQEQLGLKLVPARGPLDVIVIDHAERPSEN